MITNFLISMFALSFMFMKDCEHANTSGIIASIWSLTTSWMLIVITNGTLLSFCLVLLSIIGGAVMFLSLNKLKIIYHAMFT